MSNISTRNHEQVPFCHTRFLRDYCAEDSDATEEKEDVGEGEREYDGRGWYSSVEWI